MRIRTFVFLLVLLLASIAATVALGQGPAVEPALIAEPAEGPPGITILVSGTGFDHSDCGANIYWQGVDGPLLGFAAVAEGRFSLEIAVPDFAIPGEYAITAQGLQSGEEFCGPPSSDRATTPFTVTPLQTFYDYNIYLQQRVLRDPGVDPACLAAIQSAVEPNHAIVQLVALPGRNTEPPLVLTEPLAKAIAVPKSFGQEPIGAPVFLPFMAKDASTGVPPIDLDDLGALGIIPLNYLNGIAGPGTAYLASVSPDVDADDPAFAEMIRGLVCLEPSDKLQVGLLGLAAEAGETPVIVGFFSDVEAEEARAALAELDLPASPFAPPGLWQTTATVDKIQALAELDPVQWVEFGPLPDLPAVDEVRAASNVDAVQDLDTATGVYGGLSGAGVQIGIRDTGVDEHHNDFAGRIIRVDHPAVGANQTDHGTHVAGIAAGSGFQSDKNDDASNPNGGTPFQWRGMAPQAGIAAYRWGSITGMLADSVNNYGADITSHSYILEDQGRYNAAVASIDSLLRGLPAIPPFFPGVPPRPAVWAAANNGNWGPRDCDGDMVADGNFPQYPSGCPAGFQTGYFSVLAPCKNCIAVANLTKGLNHANGSSIGPTMDGRLKPEVAAIGSGVFSVGADLDSTGAATTGNGYRTKGGTSMAAPAVAGIGALLLEQYANTFGVNLDIAPPLPSTIKAILVQTAQDLTGSDTANSPDLGVPLNYGAGPDWATGFGLVDAQAAVTLIRDRAFIEGQLSLANVTDEFTLSVVPGQTEVRVSLAWDDLAGTPNSNAAAAMLVNDLDLTVIEPGGTVHRPLVLPIPTPRDCDGNVANGVQVGTCPGLDGAAQNYFGPAAEGVDRRNNVEQVLVAAPGGLTPGNWTVRVSVLNDDGVSTRLPIGGSQPYSLAGVTALRADLSINKSDTPDPVAAGAELVYTVSVTNEGPDTATDVIVIDALPAGVTYLGVSGAATCSQAPPGTLTCNLGDLTNGQTKSFDITVRVEADLVYNNGGPLAISNVAQAFSTIPDEALDDNSMVEDTQVIAVADLDIVSFDVVSAPDELLIGQPGEIRLHKQITNHGPSAPFDVALATQAMADPGVTVMPANLALQEMALGLEELRLVEEIFAISCETPGSHTFTFANEIGPLDPADSDPDLSNNEAEAMVTIECVIPVQINIKPGSDPNSINPGSRDVIPIAVLTTMAGEYGLPLDFDATTINPLSVRFGPKDPVWDETGGAFEAHGRGHIEDSRELDEVTRDGDDDMVLHFHVQETGITVGDVEACAKGEWLGPMGTVFKFFGCDAVRITPNAH